MTSGPAAGRLSRRTFLGAAVAGAAAISLRPSAARAKSSRSPRRRRLGPAEDALFAELDAKIEAAMAAYSIPGVAVGVLYAGQEYLKGYGVTNVDHPVPVDGDTLFRICSTTKTFTGTALMRLVDQGKVDLDARVQRYLPDFATADEKASAKITVRQLLNHTPGFLGDDYHDTGPGDNALARYAASMSRLPQLTSPGKVFAYNNAALSLAGRVIEVVTGSTYEASVQDLVLDPLGLDHSRFDSDDIVGFNIAACHTLDEGVPVVEPAAWPIPRSGNPTGGLISSARDQLRFASFHLGDGTAPDGRRLLKRTSLTAMRSHPGAGGTLITELDGMGVTWMLRPSAEGPTIVQHGGTGPGQYSGFMMVPDRGFALTLLTNSDGGSSLRNELFTDDWALQRFAGVSNLPAESQSRSPRELAPYEGRYVGRNVSEQGEVGETIIELRGNDGQLRGTLRNRPIESLDEPLADDPATEGEETSIGLAFYRDDFVLDLDADGQPVGTRSNFVRGPDGNVAWWRFHGRLYAAREARR